MKEGKLTGTWTASPEKDVTITLTILDNDRFTWTVNAHGTTHKMEGASTHTRGVLTLVSSDNQTLAGEVTWQDDGGFKFKLVGGPPQDPGLLFHKAS